MSVLVIVQCMVFYDSPLPPYFFNEWVGVSSLKYYAIISNSYLDFNFSDNSLNCIVKLSDLNCERSFQPKMAMWKFHVLY